MTGLGLETRVQGFHAGIRLYRLVNYLLGALKGQYSGTGKLRNCSVWLQDAHGENKKIS